MNTPDPHELLAALKRLVGEASPAAAYLKLDENDPFMKAITNAREVIAKAERRKC